jgi:REP element-mobilizing transposase RayT
MGSYTQLLYQIVFSTKNREKVLIKENRGALYKYIWGVLVKNKCKVYAINGIEDHIHIAVDIHPTKCISSLVKDIKVASSIWIKENNVFRNFKSWQIGYGAFTYSIDAKRNLIHYIENQEEHHKVKNSKDEYLELLSENVVEFEEKYIL